MKTSIYYILAIITVCFLTTQTIIAQKGSEIKTVVIDAGHGGKDPGAVGKHSYEKNIALAVALKTGGYIKKNFPGVKVIYTRTTDKFIPLHKRGDIANKNNADLFISIHCNANNSSKIYGTETYVLGIEEKRTKRNDVAMKENAAILFEDDAEEKYEDFNVNSPQSLILLSLYQDENLDQSLDIAGKIQKQFTQRVGRKDRSVQQAGFLVLWKTAMPSVLVELGYLSNPAEEKFLRSKEGQVFMASAIYRAFKEYKLEFEKENRFIETEVKTDKPKPETPKITKTNVEYRVQFYSNSRQLKNTASRFKKVSNIKSYQHNGMYKYTSGNFSSFEKANNHRKTVKNKGFSDAFVVAFHNGNRVSISEAKVMSVAKKSQ